MSFGRFARALLVVTGLGAAAGALVGLVGGFGYVLVSGGSATVGFRVAVGGAGIGAVFGGVLGPLLGFGLLRDVALGKAILVTGIGALAGLAVSVATGVNLFAAGIGGMIVSALGLRAVTSITRRKSLPADRSGSKKLEP